jgi:hypothetical protein
MPESGEHPVKTTADTRMAPREARPFGESQTGFDGGSKAGLFRKLHAQLVGSGGKEKHPGP